uniref:Branched-chain-amino-acid aminotransferase n=1 Tax=Chromera velia CCMP2878 TaxID=1169474 RepID=A0A0G4HLC3_9ALVE|mmetsp:Transcript_14006/g.28018  ORF Transcript_14006/g.28018 Transcript_14006/m.28018 type:complete len:464 (+) Transcript_14006:92-1483(+)|eukprot:Cvel_28953.t1-p1 / transcript=Cvel_28953.t1 / gene=Cvel_28953 / organism=Chromera_velia_CCMP2878 / gene_product=Branched-chain-amino-acid aminotransferase, putative / transcript_product=Branched-chain-amino-acid aminotransferase, putative / location=Cvel_scaffold3884:10834-12222(-) / protein_length=463 / sequence_SO=supercontig / SO=protein_coding / is_pseudo=false
MIPGEAVDVRQWAEKKLNEPAADGAAALAKKEGTERETFKTVVHVDGDPQGNILSTCLANEIGGVSGPLPLDADRLIIQRKKGPSTTMPPLESLAFGRFFSDHMLEIDWDHETGWHSPSIHPFQNLSLHPAASSLHYSLQCFEGMKAYKSAKSKKDGGEGEKRILMFRPNLNMARFKKSCARLALPDFDSNQLIKLIMKLLEVDSEFIPDQEGYSIYIRPTAIATQPTLGVSAPLYSKIFVVLSPVGPYYPTGFKPVSILAESRFVRAWPGGSGDTKVGGNYGPTIRPQAMGAEEGFQQLLWLYPEAVDGETDQMLTEVGTMNLFVYWISEEGEAELVTPPLESNLILPGVTRKSILDLARQMAKEGSGSQFEGLKVRERKMYMNRDFLKAHADGRIKEVFGAGTAAVISPVNLLSYKGVPLPIPLDPSDPSRGSGPLAAELLQRLQDIQYGRTDSEWSWPVC